MSKRHWFIDAGLIVIVILLGVLVMYKLSNVFKPSGNISETAEAVVENDDQIDITEESELPVSEDVSTPALDFTLMNLTGEKVSLSDYLGTPVMVNFWATWCPPCRSEMPLIQEYQDKYEGKFVVLAINGGESKEDIQSFADANQFSLIFLLDPDLSVPNLYQVRGLPTSLFIDVNGIHQATHIGELNAALFDTYLQKIGVSE